MRQYKYEIHAHARESSACGRSSAAEIVEAYVRAGYDGLIITDHLCEDSPRSLAQGASWRRGVDDFLSGYRAARKAAQNTGFDVMLGMEIRFVESFRDCLVYGLDERFLYDHPDLHKESLRRFYEAYGGECLIVAAHPFRSGVAPTDPRYVHGLEVVNAHPRAENHNERALALSVQYPNLCRTCGSDAHCVQDAARAALLFDKRLSDMSAFVAEVKKDAYVMWCPGFQDVPDAVCL